MKRVLLFVTMCVAAGVGGVLGSVVGHASGPGGVLFGGFLGGVLLVTAAGFLCERTRWINHTQRLWTQLGGVFGFLLAYMVALSTLSSPVGPALSTLLVGTGALLGAIVGDSAHDKRLDPSRAR